MASLRRKERSVLGVTAICSAEIADVKAHKVKRILHIKPNIQGQNVLSLLPETNSAPMYFLFPPACRM